MSGRVVHVASGREWRGGQRQVWLLARELERSGIGQVVVTGAGSELERRLRADGVRVRAVGWRAGLDPRALRGALAELDGAALIHAHDAHALTLAGAAAAWRGRPLVVTRRAVFPLRRRGFWSRAARVIAISDAVRAALVRDGIAAERIEVIPSGIDLAAVRDTPPAGLRARLGLPAGAPLAVSVAALTPEKDPETLVAAAALARPLLPHLHWVLAGEGTLRGALETIIQAKSLGDRVHLVGHEADATGLIADASVFVLASRSEGLGTAMLAALARGVPVVATRVGGIPEVLDGGAGSMVPPGDAKAMADAVARVLTDGQWREGLVRAGSATVARFGVSRMAEGVVRVYRSCAPFN